MRDQLVNRAEELELPEQYLQRLWDRLHFAKESVQDIGGRLAPLLQEWTTPRARLITHAEELHAPRTHTCREAELNVTRLDGTVVCIGLMDRVVPICGTQSHLH